MKWFVLLCIPAVAAADKYSMRWVRDEAILSANHAEARVEVSFVGTKLVVTDSGSSKTHNLSTDELTTWANTWSGTYKIDADTMKAELTLKHRKCSKTRSSSRAAGKTEPCDPIDKVIKLHCVFYETIFAPASRKPQDFEMLWNCSTNNKLGETPLPWVFGGKAPCIDATADGSNTTYKRC